MNFNTNMTKYKDTVGWFKISEIKNRLLDHVLKNQKRSILEIGSYEGLSACFFSDNIMDHEESSLDCVDPFYPSGSVDGITSLGVSKITEENFHDNISRSKNFKKIITHKMTSDDFFEINEKIYDFIYIDGCHEPDFFTKDIENSWKILNKAGIMWMDDYGGNTTGRGKVKSHMDKALDKYKAGFDVLHRGYQLAIKKI